MHQKDISLEAARGLASIVVLVWHCSLGFFPAITGMLGPSGSLAGNPLFVLINGPAAVSLFFVLSGFVLTRRFFLDGNPSSLIRGTIKRWPRLMLPVLLSVMASYACFHFGLYYYREAGTAARSQWLYTFALNDQYLEPLTFARFFWDGFLLTFFRDEIGFNPNLWTMRVEMVGSLISFSFAALLAGLRRYHWSVLLYMAVLCTVGTHFLNMYCTSFVVGTLLAACLPVRIETPFWTRLLAIAVALFLLGFPQTHLLGFPQTPPDVYSFLFMFEYPVLSIYPSVLASALLIAAITTAPQSRSRALSLISVWLGHFSFPIYLMQLPVLFSLGCYVYLQHGPAAATAATAVGTILVSIPLMLINMWWVDTLNRVVNRLRMPQFAPA